MMDMDEFNGFLLCKTPRIVDLIVEHHHIDEISALKDFLESDLYAALENEETKLWHLSDLMLFTLYDEEKRTGVLRFPDVV